MNTLSDRVSSPEKLSSDHDLSQFQCGEPTLDDWLRRRALQNEESGASRSELPIASHHVVAIESLPTLHKDPFDRVLVAQATVDGVTLLTVDPLVAPGPYGLCERNPR